MTTSDRGSDRGILYPARLPSFRRVPAPEQVADRVRWFWIPEWDVAPGRVSRQQVIAYPASNLVVEPAFVALAGPTTRCSAQDLTGRGWAVGALLQPAAVPSLAPDPVAERDGYRHLELPDLHAAVTTVMTDPDREPGGLPGHRRAVEAFSAWIGDTVPAADADGLLANAMASAIDDDPTLVHPEQVVARLHVSVRTLQRLARRHVGVSPGSMIRRRRLQAAAELVRTRPDTDLARLAADLGYADHAHLAQDFRTTLGFTPTGYRTAGRDVGGDPGHSR